MMVTVMSCVEWVRGCILSCELCWSEFGCVFLCDVYSALVQNQRVLPDKLFPSRDSRLSFDPGHLEVPKRTNVLVPQEVQLKISETT